MLTRIIPALRGLIMRCKACNKRMNDLETTRKYENTGEYVDLCTTCLKLSEYTGIVVERKDLEYMITEIDADPYLCKEDYTDD